ncbi:MAG: hypothetical protein AAGA77_05700 [Bacteroidota bacterium]
MKYTVAIVFVLTLSLHLSAQNGGMRIYAGITSMANKDRIANPEGHAHSGFHVGADGRLMSGTMAFLVGARYTSVSKRAIRDFKLSGHPSTLGVMNGRVGLDLSLYSFTPFARIRTKALASFDVILTETGNAIPPPGFMLNDGWFGVVTGLGADLGPAIIDVEYEFGILNAYNKKKGSTFNSLTLSVGFFF